MTRMKNLNLRLPVIVFMVFMAAFSRLLPHPPNFTPIGAMALFGAAYFSRRGLALAIPIMSLWLSDLVLNNVIYAKYYSGFVWVSPTFYWTYGAFILIGLAGFVLLKKIKVQNLLFASLMASVIFFIISNFGVWASSNMYPKDFNGLVVCYTAGLPFLENTLAGNLFYTAIMFGAFELGQYKIGFLRARSF